MKIITVGREFGSGGRELGKRLAEELGFAYYDDEILTAVAQKSGLAQSYVRSIVEQSSFQSYPITYGKTFFLSDLNSDNHWKIIQAQNEVLKELAEKSDCIFVGRCADVILDKMNPLKLFVYADMDSKLVRCKANAPEGENLTDKELIKKIKETEKNRERYYRAFTERTWGDKENHHLCINTSGREIKDLVPAVAEFCRVWFR
jgi:cytidylate kinase